MVKMSKNILDLYEEPRLKSPAYLDPPKVKKPMFDTTSSSITDKLKILKSSQKYNSETGSVVGSSTRRMSWQSSNSTLTQKQTGGSQNRYQSEEEEEKGQDQKAKLRILKESATAPKLKSNIFTGPNYKSVNKIRSNMSDTSEKSADLRSLAGSHNFASVSSNVESVFGSTSGSGGSFSVSSSIRSPGRGLG